MVHPELAHETTPTPVERAEAVFNSLQAKLGPGTELPAAFVTNYPNTFIIPDQSSPNFRTNRIIQLVETDDGRTWLGSIKINESRSQGEKEFTLEPGEDGESLWLRRKVYKREGSSRPRTPAALATHMAVQTREVMPGQPVYANDIPLRGKKLDAFLEWLRSAEPAT